MKRSLYLVLLVIAVLGLVLGITGCAGSQKSVEKDQSAASAAPAASSKNADMNGLWIMTVETPQGSGSPSFDLQQEGDQLSGTYSGRFGEFPVKGTVTGNRFVIEYESSGTLVKYMGEVTGDKVKGEVDYGSYGGGTFIGER